MKEFTHGNIKLLNMDCMEFMKTVQDGYFELCIVDPPYGIEDKISKGGGSHTKTKTKFHNMYSENHKKWDIRPKADYFNELFRVSKNQIICGANYFVENLPVSRGWAVWDKKGGDFTSVNDELIFTSFDISIKTFGRNRCMDNGFMSKSYSIHPTQKPKALYDWLLANYAKTGDKILDTHLGSGSSAIAAHYAGHEFTGCELDSDYFVASVERFKIETAQESLF
jgi:site-specific DNA-methyltransferase (adenine-specific)